MDPYLIDFFFSLKTFVHKVLWKKGEAVWSPLSDLKNYLDGFRHRIEIELPSGVLLENREKISIGAGTIIEPGVLIQGPCVIGKKCNIRHGAYLREYSLVGDRCSIGHAAEIKHSILLDGAAVTHFSYVGNSIVGNDANLGAGVKCANLRLDRKEVSVFVDEKRVSTGLKKMGAIIGDRVQIGCNCVLNPGTLVGRDSVSHPLLVLKGSIPPFSQVKSKVALHIEPLGDPRAILEQMGRLV